MSVLYEVLEKIEETDPFERAHKVEIDGFSIRREAGFFRFHKSEKGDEALREMDLTWKIHFSVKPEQLSNAWDKAIGDLLIKYSECFKIVDTEGLARVRKENEQAIQEAQKTLVEFKAESQAYLSALAELDAYTNEDKKKHPINRPYLTGKHVVNAITYGVITEQACIDLITSPESIEKEEAEQALAIKTLEAVHLAQKSELDTIPRLEHGMQITVYVRKGEEAAYQQLAERVEKALKTNQIAPGTIHASDRALGQYASIRHPGEKEHHPSNTVTSYNPERIDDPFEVIGADYAKSSFFGKEVKDSALSFSSKITQQLRMS